MNIIDKALAAISPVQALKRADARRKLKVLNEGYGNHGASTKKKSMLGWLSRSASAVEDIEYNLGTLRSRSRDLWMGSPLATGAIKTLRTNVVGSGLKLNAQIDADYLNMTYEEADQWETHVEREFALWAESIHCDAQRMNNFYELQQLVLISYLISGDCFSLLPLIPRSQMPYDLRVQLLEADRVCNPNNHISFDSKIVNGVEINDIGEIVAYHIAKYHPGSASTTMNKWTRVEKFGSLTGRPNIIHLMESERPEQRRGVPILAPVMESLKQLSRYSEAELMAAVINGMYSVFVTTETAQQSANEFQGIDDEDLIDEEDDSTIELGSGTVHFLGENEKIQESNPGRPNPNFDGFVISICRQIGAATEIPYELLVKNFTASYSASRGALLEAWKMFKMRREWLANDFCQPIYEEFLAEGIAKGRIYAPGFFTDPLARKAYCGAEWNGPSQGQIDPLKEVDAAIKRVDNGFSTRAQETVGLTGGDFFRNHRLRVIEERMRSQDGVIPGQSPTETEYPSDGKEDEG